MTATQRGREVERWHVGTACWRPLDRLTRFPVASIGWHGAPLIGERAATHWWRGDDLRRDAGWYTEQEMSGVGDRVEEAFSPYPHVDFLDVLSSTPRTAANEG
jgi:hypothetical protein